MAKAMHKATEHLVRSYQRRLARPDGRDRVSEPRKTVRLRRKRAQDERSIRDKSSGHGKNPPAR